MPKEREECREQLGKASVLGIIIRSLEDPLPGIRIAACTCIRSLSRSAKALRKDLMEENVAGALFPLLDDAVADVQAEASATLCNMVMDFSPIKVTPCPHCHCPPPLPPPPPTHPPTHKHNPLTLLNPCLHL